MNLNFLKQLLPVLFFMLFAQEVFTQNTKSAEPKAMVAAKTENAAELTDEEEELLKDPYCLEVSGQILQGSNVLTRLDVIVYCDGKVMDQYNTINEKTFKAGFKRNRLYTLVIKKAGYIPLVVIVNTTMPQQKKETLNRFYFETTLKSVKNNLNPEYTDHPAAYLSYLQGEKAFNLSTAYNTFIKDKLTLKKK